MHVNFLPKILVNSYSPIYFPVYKCNLIHKPECSILCGCLKILDCACIRTFLRRGIFWTKHLKYNEDPISKQNNNKKYHLSLIPLS